uniref:Uncharacterized protein n=1 Tax=Chromera velia CCMP2878 TaxID=1169474 RepID=A0A0G4G0J6_9ALVE|eukprot:Cvel_19555.t1-p1 / transcript=Cvel_19555.t1 / gene=Cvel_19555 / organism=Chromera_velia_CCMP2878 / gene_product=hypothetical protein / transcript_product=hypothetical protein / location=Cvel_scaffold1695:9101-9790(-) / protein_length=230 / sequence_SO=supercontig / SO=protein_coding / is_pseudo=false
MGKRKNRLRGEDGRFLPATPTPEENSGGSSNLSDAVAAIAKSTEVLLTMAVAQQQASTAAATPSPSSSTVLSPSPSAFHNLKFEKWECKLKYEDRSYAGRQKIISSFEDHLRQQPSATAVVVAFAFHSGLESFPELHNLISELPSPFRDDYEYMKNKILKASGEQEEKRLVDSFQSLATLSSSQSPNAKHYGNAVETACQRIAILSLREERVCTYSGNGDENDDSNWKVV